MGELTDELSQRFLNFLSKQKARYSYLSVVVGASVGSHSTQLFKGFDVIALPHKIRHHTLRIDIFPFSYCHWFEIGSKVL